MSAHIRITKPLALIAIEHILPGMKSEYPKYVPFVGEPFDALVSLTEKTFDAFSNVGRGLPVFERSLIIAQELISLARLHQKEDEPNLTLSTSPTDEERERLLNDSQAIWREDGSRVVFLAKQ